MNKKLLVALSFLLFLTSKILAQDGGPWDKRTNVYGVETRTNALELGAEYLFPAGSFGETYNNGVGASLRFKYGITQYKSFLISVGYNSFKGKVVLPGNNPAVNVRANFIPIKIGIKFGLSDNLYLAGEIGGTVGLGVNGISDVNEYARDSYQIKGAVFNYAPSFGILIPTKNKNYIDLSVRYEGFTYNQSANYFTGIRAAYAFNISR